MSRRRAVPQRFAAVHAAYVTALRRAPLDDDTRRAYASRVRGFLTWLADADLDGVDALADPRGRDRAVRGYRGHLKTVARRTANTVNAHLAALDHFYDHLGLGPVDIRRDTAPRPAPRALDTYQQRRYLRAVARLPLTRDRAIGRLLLCAGLRISELVALDVDDLRLSARTATVVVRRGGGAESREIPLRDARVRTELSAWKEERAAWPGADGRALFLNRRGSRLSARAVDQLLDVLAVNAGLVDEDGVPLASAHTLRYTFAANLLRDGVDLLVVARLLGHRSLDTTRRYTFPGGAGREETASRPPTAP